MKNSFQLCLALIFLFTSLFISACDKNERSWTKAEITGFDARLCMWPCCAGYWIDVDGETYMNHNYFELIGVNPGTATYPIVLEIEYEINNDHACPFLIILEIKN